MTPKFHDEGAHLSLVCPCGAENVHISAVSVDRNGAVIRVDHEQEAHLSHRDNASLDYARGAFVVIECWCEDGCCFGLRTQFHKGVVFLEIRDHRPNAYDVGGDSCPRDLWRD